jgi:hypothetical protein
LTCPIACSSRGISVSFAEAERQGDLGLCFRGAVYALGSKRLYVSSVMLQDSSLGRVDSSLSAAAALDGNSQKRRRQTRGKRKGKAKIRDKQCPSEPSSGRSISGLFHSALFANSARLNLKRLPAAAFPPHRRQGLPRARRRRPPPVRDDGNHQPALRMLLSVHMRIGGNGYRLLNSLCSGS